MGDIFGAENDEYLVESAKFQGTILFLLMLTEIFGFVLNWKYRRAGALIVIFASIALLIFTGLTAERNVLLAMASSGLPFLIVGILIF